MIKFIKFFFNKDLKIKLKYVNNLNKIFNKKINFYSENDINIKENLNDKGWELLREKNKLPIIEKIIGNTEIKISLKDGDYIKKGLSNEIKKNEEDIHTGEYNPSDKIEKKQFDLLDDSGSENIETLSNFLVEIKNKDKIHLFDCDSKEGEINISNYIILESNDNIKEYLNGTKYIGPNINFLDYYVQISIYELLRIHGINEILAVQLEALNYEYNINKLEWFKEDLISFIEEQKKINN